MPSRYYRTQRGHSVGVASPPAFQDPTIANSTTYITFTPPITCTYQQLWSRLSYGSLGQYSSLGSYIMSEWADAGLRLSWKYGCGYKVHCSKCEVGLHKLIHCYVATMMKMGVGMKSYRAFCDEMGIVERDTRHLGWVKR